MLNNILELLIYGANQLHIRLDEKAVSNFLKYTEILGIWNTKVNLVSYKNPSDLIIFHILDCLTLLKVIDTESQLKLMDVGSGAGFPGMVLKIAQERLDVTLVEKNPKRTLFLKETVRNLGLREIAVLNKDYNSLKNVSHFQKYDIVVSRAFSSKPVFFKNLTFFIRNNGAFIIMAGPSFNIDSIIVEGFEVSHYWEGKLPFSESERKLIKYSKID